VSPRRNENEREAKARHARECERVRVRGWVSGVCLRASWEVYETAVPAEALMSVSVEHRSNIALTLHVLRGSLRRHFFSTFASEIVLSAVFKRPLTYLRSALRRCRPLEVLVSVPCGAS